MHVEQASFFTCTKSSCLAIRTSDGQCKANLYQFLVNILHMRLLRILARPAGSAMFQPDHVPLECTSLLERILFFNCLIVRIDSSFTFNYFCKLLGWVFNLVRSTIREVSQVNSRCNSATVWKTCSHLDRDALCAACHVCYHSADAHIHVQCMHECNVLISMKCRH